MSRFSTVQFDEFVQDNLDSRNTKDLTNFSVKILRDFCLDRDQSAEFEELDAGSLCDLLCDFYPNIRTVSGGYYSKSSLLAIRQGLNRHLKGLTTKNDGDSVLDIVVDMRFASANRVFKAMLKKTREEGKGAVEHKPPLAPNDIKKLYKHETFDPNTPHGLLHKVWFEVILYFCRRGRENIREMKPSDFNILFDDTGRKYIKKITTEKTKNHQGTTNENEHSGGRMYSTDTPMCPVRSFEKYIAKLNPKCDALFQRPCDSFCPDDPVWFENKPLGKNTLGNMMKTISLKANLSQMYTNHSVRATTITLLSDAGFEARHIKTISGHRNESSITSYCTDTSTIQKQQMSDAISATCKPNLEKPGPSFIAPNESLLPSSITNSHSSTMLSNVMCASTSSDQQIDILTNPQPDEEEFNLDEMINFITESVWNPESCRPIGPSQRTHSGIPCYQNSVPGPNINITNSTVNFYYK